MIDGNVHVAGQSRCMMLINILSRRQPSSKGDHLGPGDGLHVYVCVWQNRKGGRGAR